MKMKKIISLRKLPFYIDLHSILMILKFLTCWRIMKPLLPLGIKLNCTLTFLGLKEAIFNKGNKYFKVFLHLSPDLMILPWVGAVLLIPTTLKKSSNQSNCKKNLSTTFKMVAFWTRNAHSAILRPRL